MFTSKYFCSKIDVHNFLQCTALTIFIFSNRYFVIESDFDTKPPDEQMSEDKTSHFTSCLRSKIINHLSSFQVSVSINNFYVIVHFDAFLHESFHSPMPSTVEPQEQISICFNILFRISTTSLK